MQPHGHGHFCRHNVTRQRGKILRQPTLQRKNILRVFVALNSQDFERAWPPPEGASKLKELLGTEQWRQKDVRIYSERMRKVMKIVEHLHVGLESIKAAAHNRESSTRNFQV